MNVEIIELELLRRMLDDWELRLWFFEKQHLLRLWTDHHRKCLALLIAHCDTSIEIMEQAQEWGDGVEDWLTQLRFEPALPDSNAELINQHWTLIQAQIRIKLVEQYKTTQNPFIISLLTAMPRHRPRGTL